MLVLLAATLAAMTALAPGAHASTVGREDPSTSLFYNGEGAEQNDLTVTGTDADFVFTDSPGVVLTPLAGCREDDDATTDNVVLCARGVNSGVIVVNLGAGDDEITTDVNFVGYLYRGGDGADTLRASTGFRSSVTMLGEGGRDVYVPGRPGENFEVVSYSERSTPLTATMNDLPDDPDGENIPSNMNGVVGGQGDDTVIGSAKSDYLAGAGGQDRVVGLGGADNVNGSRATTCSKAATATTGSRPTRGPTSSSAARGSTATSRRRTGTAPASRAS
jgi:Ca2+-binding RTX toxin-like protein